MKMDTRVLFCAASGIGHLNPMIAVADKLCRLGVLVEFVCHDNSSFSFVSGAPEAGKFEVGKLFVDDPEAPAVPSKKAVGRLVVKRGFKPELPWPDYSSHQSQFELMLQNMAEANKLPAAVVYDACTTWASAPASKFSIPTYVTNGNSTISLALDLYTTGLNGKGGQLPLDGPIVSNIPGFPPTPTDQVQFKIDMLEGSFGHIRKQWDEQVLKSDGLLVNSSFEIDASIVKAMQDGAINEGLAGKVFVLGPLMGKERNEPTEEQLKLLKWLDDQPPRSVIFICFGSWEGLFEKQVVELAAGLEAVGCRFLWMEAYEGEVPDEFRKKMANQGLIACGYAPQQRILAHPSVGAFLTHCGWNSIVECLSLGGIPMVAWGLILDQPVNAALVAHLGVGVEAMVNAEDIVERQEAERAIRLVMEGETAAALRARAAEIKEKIWSEKAVKESEREIERLISKIFSGKFKSAKDQA